MRDATINDYLMPLDRVGGFLVYKEGQAAMRLLSELASSPEGKRGGNAARIGRALASLADGKATEARQRDRGALVLKATWDKGVDLDLALLERAQGHED